MLSNYALWEIQKQWQLRLSPDPSRGDCSLPKTRPRRNRAHWTPDWNRDLLRSGEIRARNELKADGTDSSLSSHEAPSETLIDPLANPGPGPCSANALGAQKIALEAILSSKVAESDSVTICTFSKRDTIPAEKGRRPARGWLESD